MVTHIKMSVLDSHSCVSNLESINKENVQILTVFQTILSLVAVLTDVQISQKGYTFIITIQWRLSSARTGVFPCTK